jgi:hypothetical protein
MTKRKITGQDCPDLLGTCNINTKKQREVNQAEASQLAEMLTKLNGSGKIEENE